MRLGICLPGGGAKGAFQGGALKRLLENGVKPYILTGTSIGAVNAYFILKDSTKEMEYIWLNMDSTRYQGKIDKVIDNSKLLEELSRLNGHNDYLKSVYINYVEVNGRRLTEKVVDIKNMDKEDALRFVGYSSLLPLRVPEGENYGKEAVTMKFDSQRVFQYFKEDVENGVYDGYRLDGGILNNNLVSPFIDDRVNKIVIIALKDGYEVPEYIYDYYSKDDIIVIEPDRHVEPGETLMFERKYCKDMFERGYRLAGEILNML
ncbi:patatin-like phospholipase family protein [Fonticella tunisiensis]|uniref:Patatin-like phospholipase n=1 Tax=Fonticella tunisiensis TaxID=1096341 RepID=A0A4R7KPN2_9CLOT|nr:patatin-like phospholipase family protein [Fonticella tunisiensis]TDT60965.1 patatin-like phospholipase [Fonticella tunisiensis]